MYQMLWPKHTHSDQQGHPYSSLSTPIFPILCKRLRDQEGEDETGVRNDLDSLGGALDLAPADALVRSGTRVTAVELLRGVHVHRVVGAVAHQVRVERVVLHHTAAQHDHAGAEGVDRQPVDPAHVLHHVHSQPRGAVAVAEQHVPDRPVR